MTTGFTVSAIFGCVGAGWTPKIGDPTAQGWITVLVYLACAILSLMVWRSRVEPGLRQFWAVTAGLMLLLAVNKQLDLQTAFTETGRCLSHAQGWYPWRGYVQMLFIAVLGVGLYYAMRHGMRMMRGYMPSHRLALIGTGFVAGYVLLRATSFHLIDMVGGTGVAGLSMNFILENAGLMLIAVNAVGLLTGRIVPREVLPKPKPKPAPEPKPVAKPKPAAAQAKRPFSGTPPRKLPQPMRAAEEEPRQPFSPLEPRDR